MVYVAGGTRTAWPHVFYFPIVLAAVSFRVRGAIMVAVAATLLCGPAMPLDTAAGVSQGTANWLTRGGFFVGIGLVVAGAFQALHRAVQTQLSEHFDAELEAVTTPGQSSRTDVASAQARVRDVLARNAFHPVYQPIYALDDGRLVAVEALTRFDVEPYEPPDVWFDRAEQLGLGTDLDMAALEAAFVGARQLPRDVMLHVNAAPSTMMRPEFLDLVRSQEHPVTVEVTEHAVVDDYPKLARSREMLRQCGIQLAIDDAGAGFASLRHIVRLAPDVIKLDRSLTRDLHQDSVRHALAEALAQFASRTGSLLIAEGIEEQSDLDAWRRLGVYAAQGYLLARPGGLPVPELCTRLQTGRRRLATVATG